MKNEFKQAAHTIVLSDMHLADAEPPHPGNSLWKRYKRPKFFTDRTFKRLLEHLSGSIEGQIELVLNGDIFDFDSVMSIPDHPPFRVNWLERRRGLKSQEAKSVYKIGVILTDHYIWTEAISEFIQRGNRVVFVIGNHDMELHWPAAQQKVLDMLKLPKPLRKNVRFCEWFYISNGDTLIEHGNQYDSYCLCSNPIHPLIRIGRTVVVRLPFGNLAGKLMLNGMGLMNPHVDSSYIKSSLWEYAVFFYTYVMRTQPLLPWDWFWSACATLVISVREGLLPALRDPLTVEARVEEIAERANTEPKIVRTLNALHVHPAIFNPLRILRELWLDRAFFLAIIFLASFQFFSFINLFARVSFWWFLVPFLLLFPIFIFYARSIESGVTKVQKVMMGRVPISSRIAQVQRVIHGHTHYEMHVLIKNIELINTGTWSPAYKDVECTQPMGRKCFAWIKPGPKGEGRVSELFEWADPEVRSIPVSEGAI
ncbi:MAG: metallophosphoesterase [Bacteriovoracia bacterium]